MACHPHSDKQDGETWMEQKKPMIEIPVVWVKKEVAEIDLEELGIPDDSEEETYCDVASIRFDRINSFHHNDDIRCCNVCLADGRRYVCGMPYRDFQEVYNVWNDSGTELAELILEKRKKKCLHSPDL